MLSYRSVTVEKKIRPPTLLLFGLLALFTIAFLHTAWIAEDAFITFRTIDNALGGLGLRWNPAERVQTFTHPLWLGLLLPAIGVFGDPYFITVGLSFALLIATLLLIGRTLGTWSPATCMAIIALLWSRSFIDYSSSGLENPLTHALIAASVWANLKIDSPTRKSLALAALASALFLARPDAVLLIAPALASHLWTVRRQLRSHCAPMLLGLAPAILWIAFSLFYYGAPVPNTALAKLGTGLSLQQKALQAWRYIAWTVQTDFVTAALIITGSVVGMAGRNRDVRPFAIGLIVWLAYLVCIGGDYMAGRFFSAPVLLAAILLTLEMHRYGTRPAACAIALLLLLNMSALNLTLFSPARFAATSIQPSGIADERGFYYQALGLVPVLQRGTWFVHPWLLEGRAARAAGGTQVRCFIGMAGYTGGPEVHWIDPLALSEPFLARLPSRTNARVGHYERAFPAGYFESMAAHKNLIADARMAALYEDVDLAVRAPLLADGRLAAIWRLNSGSHADAAKNFDREAVGMPGVRIWNHSPFSCLGK